MAQPLRFALALCRCGANGVFNAQRIHAANERLHNRIPFCLRQRRLRNDKRAGQVVNPLRLFRAAHDIHGALTPSGRRLYLRVLGPSGNDHGLAALAVLAHKAMHARYIGAGGVHDADTAAFKLFERLRRCAMGTDDNRPSRKRAGILQHMDARRLQPGKHFPVVNEAAQRPARALARHGKRLFHGRAHAVTKPCMFRYDNAQSAASAALFPR